jgi:polysaccharide pyruvyl transferase WcaK-like protein
MNLHLVNEYSSNNLGDAVIYESFVQLASPICVHSRLDQSQRDRVRGLFPASTPTVDDIFASVGGDIFNNARRHFVTKRFLQNLRMLAACPRERSFLFGQSIPDSCQGLAFRILCGVLRRLSSVTVRDEKSHRRLQDVGVTAELSFDIAFAYLPSADSSHAGRALFARYEVDPERCVLVSVRGFNAMYPHDGQRFITKIAELCQLLFMRGHVPTVLLQANVEEGDSDRLVVAELRRRIPKLAVMQPLQVGGGHHPIDAFVGAIALAHAVVAVRFHTTILRLLSGRQSYNLNYSSKGQDITNRLTLPGVDLDAFDPIRAVKDIELSATGCFDPVAQRTNVRSAFERSMSKAAARPWSLHSHDDFRANEISNASSLSFSPSETVSLSPSQVIKS